MNTETLRSLIAYTLVDGIGTKRLEHLLKTFHGIEGLNRASEHEIIREAKTVRYGQKLQPFHRDDIFKRADEIIAESAKRDIEIVHYEDPRYPFNLKNIDTPPLIVYVRGAIEALTRNAIGVVGTRGPTDESARFAFDISSALAHENLWVVSGLARGVDTNAHWGALSVNGNTVGVLGSGLDYIYPAENQKLYHKILDKGGALISEFYTGTAPERQNFPRRNRIISGLCYGVIVVEAAKKSGALITAHYALEQGREVYVAPFDERNERFFGNKGLAKDGARIVRRAEDILEDLANILTLPKRLTIGKAHSPKKSATPERVKKCIDNKEGDDITLTPEERAIMNAVNEKIHLDDLCETLGLPQADVVLALTDLGIRELVMQLPGKYYIKAGRENG